MKSFETLKPTSQGTLGVGVAIGYFSSLGYVVSVPLSDNQKYDLLVDIDNSIKKVQVKTTGYKRGNSYVVQLKTVCPKKLSRNKITKFDNTQVDFLFIVVEDGSLYNIPANEVVTKNAISLTEDKLKYKIL
jgi:hypothetical protein